MDLDLDKVKAALSKIGYGFCDLAEAFGEEKSVHSTSKLKSEGKKKGRKPKDEDETEEEDLEIEEDGEEDETEQDDEEAEEDEDEEAEEEDEDEETVTELELKNLKTALKKYSAEHGKPKAVKILQKFAKASQDVKRKDFAKLLKMLKV